MNSSINRVIAEVNHLEYEILVLLSQLEKSNSQDESKDVYAFGEQWPMEDFEANVEESQKLELQVEEKQEKVSSLVQEFKLVRCIYCNQWTHKDQEGAIPYVKEKIYCSEACKTCFNDDMF